MSIPLSRLYHFLHDLSNQDTIIYRFWPHGSKKPYDCKPLFFDQSTQLDKITSVHVFCHDQEPLDSTYFPMLKTKWQDIPSKTNYIYSDNEYCSYFKAVNCVSHSVYVESLLVHSEKNSQELEVFEKCGHRGVYYWSHALIARDWYRYAEHDVSLVFDPSAVKDDFLVYNRAWSGTREYRLKLAEMIVKNNLLPNCNIKFSVMEDIFDYRQHQFKNPAFKINTALEDYFEENTASSDASADYDQQDYCQSGIELVLETLFDDKRWHLTEKSLRPMATGKPFILAATPGSLEYLRSYGFRTFSPFIDESYDLIDDSVERLNAIIKLMKSIAELPQDKKVKLWTDLHKIAEWNRQWFFSQTFFNIVVDEYKKNFNSAFKKTKKHYSEVYLHQWLEQHQLPADELAAIESALDAVRP